MVCAVHRRCDAISAWDATSFDGYPGYDIASWYGVLAPAKTPRAIVARLSEEIAAATKTKAFADALPDYELIGGTPSEFGRFLKKDADISARIIAQSGAKAQWD